MRDVELPVEKRGHNDSCLAATSWHDPGYAINLRVVRTMTAVVWMHPRLIDQRHDEATTSYRNPLRFSRHFCLRLSRANRRRCQTLRHSSRRPRSRLPAQSSTRTPSRTTWVTVRLSGCGTRLLFQPLKELLIQNFFCRCIVVALAAMISSLVVREPHLETEICGVCRWDFRSEPR